MCTILNLINKPSDVKPMQHASKGFNTSRAGCVKTAGKCRDLVKKHIGGCEFVLIPNVKKRDQCPKILLRYSLHYSCMFLTLA